uniref:Protein DETOXIFICATION n=1 Tax=Aegilops tauschii subsp. strangulata TaxID=200361 RepID=A0A452ZDG3_AEGTS
MDLLGVFFHGATLAFERDDLGKEIMGIAVPGALALMADPLASLVDTAFIGRIGPVEIAAVGVSIVVFNQVTRIAVFPLVSVTTSFVAEEDATSSDRNKDEISGENEHNVSEMDELITHEENNATSGKSSFEIDSSEINTEHKRKKIPSVSTALLLGGVLGLVETLLLVSCAKPILDFMGVKADTGMLNPALQYLVLRSLGAPAVLLSLAMQGVFRGLKDTRTPLYATGSLLLARVIAATCCVTLSASMAARLGSTQMAAFQICLQIWLASSLLADGLAFAGQAILASAFARKDHSKAKATASRLLQLGLILGLLLGLLLGVGLHTGSRLFTEDQGVLHHIYVAIPFVALTQPINALAFVFDGVNYGASDFAYAAYSLILVAIVSIAFIVTLANYSGFIGIWIALSIYMCLRMFAGLWRIGTARGPWAFLRS